MKKKGVPRIDPKTASELLDQLTHDTATNEADRQSRIAARAWMLAMPKPWRGDDEPSEEWKRHAERWTRLAQLHPIRKDLTPAEIAEREAIEEAFWKEAEQQIDEEDRRADA